MSEYTLLIVEDETEVRDAIERDLTAFTPLFRLETAEDVEDARQVMQEAADDDTPVALVLCDHLLPGTHGVDFLVELNEDPRTEAVRKVLITGQAGLDDTVRAVNHANLHHYIAKPWKPEELQAIVREQLTEFVLSEAESLLPFVPALDGPRLLEAVSHRRTDR